MTRLLSLLLSLVALPLQAGDIIIRVNSAPDTAVTVYAELVTADSPDWEPAQARRQKQLAGSGEILFRDIALGEYAVRLFADQDEDGELSTSRRGLPQEPVGFSTCSIAGRRAKPPADCSFTHEAPETTVTVQLVNLRR